MSGVQVRCTTIPAKQPQRRTPYLPYGKPVHSSWTANTQLTKPNRNTSKTDQWSMYICGTYAHVAEATSDSHLPYHQLTFPAATNGNVSTILTMAFSVTKCRRRYSCSMPQHAFAEKDASPAPQLNHATIVSYEYSGTNLHTKTHTCAHSCSTPSQNRSGSEQSPHSRGTVTAKACCSNTILTQSPFGANRR